MYSVLASLALRAAALCSLRTFSSFSVVMAVPIILRSVPVTGFIASSYLALACSSSLAHWL